MTDFLTPFIVLTLIGVIVIQAVERFLFAAQAQKERHDMLKFVLSRNVKEYNEVVRGEKQIPPDPRIQTDEVELDQATDETFEKYLENS